MVILRKVKSKDKEYWVLIHSVRKGKKVTQRNKYIGKKLPPKERLGYLKEEFLKEIKGERYKYFSSEDIENIEREKEKYNEEIGKLSKLEKNKKLEEFIVRYTYDSSKLSGLDVTLRQTYLILEKRVMPKGFKNLVVARELENHEKCIIAITKYKRKLDIRFIKKMHNLLFAGVDDSIAGKLRYEIKRDVKIAGTIYVPPKWHDLKKELDGFFKWYASENRRLHPLESAALVHLKIASIQPFVDGNSRLARLLMNWILWKRGYPPIDIPIEDLEEYYDMLDNYQIEKKEKPFINYIKKKYLS
mgnify:CR=1 FL=1